VTNPILVPEIRELLATDSLDVLREFVQSSHPETVAELLSALEPGEIWQVLSKLDPALASEIFVRFEDDIQVEVVDPLDRKALAWLVTDMASDERVDLLKRIPEEKQHALLPALAKAEREDIRRLASYKEGTAGSVMTTDYATLPPSITARDAIDQLRVAAPDKETIYYAYVVDETRKLLGFVSLKDLILARPEQRVEELIYRDALSAQADEDQEVAARMLSKYGLLALPVVSAEGALVGIITHDDAMDVLAQENTEDLEKLMAIGGSHEAGAYLRTPSWIHFKNRCGWLILFAALGLISGAIVQNYEGLLLQFAVLATFMPMMADTGGNTGSQSATLVVRALALGEIKTSDLFRVLFKELRVALMLAIVLAVLCFGRVWLLGSGSTAAAGTSPNRIGLAVAVALGLQVITATLVGALLPIGAAKLKLDPAVVASPALTTIVDITGLLIYFSTAHLILSG
jgi:magnesium transporter